MYLERRFEGQAGSLMVCALAAVGDGWPVLQLAPGTKRPPEGSLGVYATTVDPAEVGRVWSATPDANVGGATGHGFIALDVDPDEGADETLAGLPEFPRTRRHQTPGGEHIILRAPLLTRGAKLGDGATVRGLGSYIVLPGSVLTTGGEFSVLDPSPIAEAPAWLLERLANHTPEGVDLPAEVLVDVEALPGHLRRIMAEVPGVDRSGKVWELVSAALEYGLDDGEVLFLARRFEPAVAKYAGRLDVELARVLVKGRARHQHPGQPCDRAGCPSTPDWMGGPRSYLPRATVADEADFWAAREVLARIRHFARARQVSPWAVLGAVLARLLVSVSPSLMLPPLPAAASLNLYAGLVGPSGFGKGTAVAVARDAVRVRYVDVAGIGSGEGIAHLFARRVRPKGQPSYVERIREAVLLKASEVDALTALDARQGSTLFSELRKGWSGEELGFAYADPDKRLPIEERTYRLCMLIGVQPERAGVLLGDVEGGLPQRLLWLPAVDPQAPEVPPVRGGRRVQLPGQDVEQQTPDYGPV
jgi:Bifunctional DNA primase/polymerase, N-terminal